MSPTSPSSGARSGSSWYLPTLWGKSAPRKARYPSRPEQFACRQPKPAAEPDIYIDMPLYSTVIIPAPPSSRTGLCTPQPFQLSAQLQIHMPSGPPKRSRGIRLVLRQWCILNLGHDRSSEFDVIDDHVQDICGEMVLHPGVQRYVSSYPFAMCSQTRIPFVLDLDPTVCRQRTLETVDKTRDQVVATHLFAQVIGEQPEDPPHHPAFDISNLPLPVTVPPYQADVAPLQRTFSTWRILVSLFNPNPAGGVSSLDDRFATFVPDLGIVRGQCVANKVCTLMLMSTCADTCSLPWAVR